MTHNEAEMKSLDEKLVKVYEVKAFLAAIDAINKIPNDGCPYPELANEGYSLAIKNLWKMIKRLEDDDYRTELKNSRLQLNEGTIYVDAESIVFRPQAFLGL